MFVSERLFERRARNQTFGVSFKCFISTGGKEAYTRETSLLVKQFENIEVE
jgi:hypothetical protein